MDITPHPPGLETGRIRSGRADDITPSPPRIWNRCTTTPPDMSPHLSFQRLQHFQRRQRRQTYSRDSPVTGSLSYSPATPATCPTNPRVCDHRDSSRYGPVANPSSARPSCLVGTRASQCFRRGLIRPHSTLVFESPQNPSTGIRVNTSSSNPRV